MSYIDYMMLTVDTIVLLSALAILVRMAVDAVRG